MKRISKFLTVFIVRNTREFEFTHLSAGVDYNVSVIVVSHDATNYTITSYTTGETTQLNCYHYNTLMNVCQWF